MGKSWLILVDVAMCCPLILCNHITWPQPNLLLLSISHSCYLERSHAFVYFLQTLYYILEKEMVTPLQYSCLENPMARGAWVGYYSVGFPGGSDSKESACNAGNLGLIPGSGRSPGEGNGYPLQYSCLWKVVVESRHRDSWPPEEKNSIQGQRWGLVAQSFCVTKFY